MPRASFSQIARMEFRSSLCCCTSNIPKLEYTNASAYLHYSRARTTTSTVPHVFEALATNTQLNQLPCKPLRQCFLFFAVALWETLTFRAGKTSSDRICCSQLFYRRVLFYDLLSFCLHFAAALCLSTLHAHSCHSIGLNCNTEPSQLFRDHSILRLRLFVVTPLCHCPRQLSNTRFGSVRDCVWRTLGGWIFIFCALTFTTDNYYYTCGVGVHCF